MKIVKNCVNKKVIENYIKNNNLSKSKFCKLCKISYSTLTRILNDENFYLSAIFKIARVMSTQVYNLFELS